MRRERIPEEPDLDEAHAASFRQRERTSLVSAGLVSTLLSVVLYLAGILYSQRYYGTFGVPFPRGATLAIASATTLVALLAVLVYWRLRA